MSLGVKYRVLQSNIPGSSNPKLGLYADTVTACYYWQHHKGEHFCPTMLLEGTVKMKAQTWHFEYSHSEYSSTEIPCEIHSFCWKENQIGEKTLLLTSRDQFQPWFLQNWHYHDICHATPPSLSSIYVMRICSNGVVAIGVTDVGTCCFTLVTLSSPLFINPLDPDDSLTACGPK